MEHIRRGLMIILSSPSGAGKSTLARKLLSWSDQMQFSVSATTRPPREGEEDGIHYHFRTKEEFKTLIDQGEMLEHAEVFDHLYGTPKQPVVAAIEAGKDVIFDVDWQGGQQIRNSELQQDTVSIFILPPSIKELHNRLVTRAKDSPDVIRSRMAQSRSEISHWAEYDYLIVNDDLDAAFDLLTSIIVAERAKRVRRPDLKNFVDQLNAEFEELK
ncbi:MAG: guanylate kinase [Pseudomonadota bacterium]